MRQLIFATVAAAVVMFPLDFLWLRTMRPFYERQMGSIMLPEQRAAAALLFYAVYAVGIALFAIQPNLSTGTIWSTAVASIDLAAVVEVVKRPGPGSPYRHDRP